MVSTFRKTLWERRQCFSVPQALSWSWNYWQKWLEKPVNKQWLLGTSGSPGKTPHPSKHEESVFWRERFPRRLARFYWTSAIIHFCYCSASFSKENFVYKFSDVLHLLKQKRKKNLLPFGMLQKNNITCHRPRLLVHSFAWKELAEMLCRLLMLIYDRF